MRREGFGGIEQQRLRNVGSLLALALKKPVGEEFQLNVSDPVVVENLLRLPERALAERMFQIGVPDAKAGEAGSGGSFHAVPEIERTVFPVGVRKSAGNGPVRSEQFNPALHGTFSGGHGLGRQDGLYRRNNLVFIGDNEVFQWFAIGNRSIEGRYHLESLELRDRMLGDLSGDHSGGGRLARR